MEGMSRVIGRDDKRIIVIDGLVNVTPGWDLSILPFIPILERASERRLDVSNALIRKYVGHKRGNMSYIELNQVHKARITLQRKGCLNSEMVIVYQNLQN